MSDKKHKKFSDYVAEKNTHFNEVGLQGSSMQVARQTAVDPNQIKTTQQLWKYANWLLDAAKEAAEKQGSQVDPLSMAQVALKRAFAGRRNMTSDAPVVRKLNQQH